MVVNLRVLKQDPQSFSTEWFSKTNFPYLCLFLLVQGMDVLFLLFMWSADGSDDVCGSVARCVCSCHRQVRLWTVMISVSALHWMLHSFCSALQCLNQGAHLSLFRTSVFKILSLPISVIPVHKGTFSKISCELVCDQKMCWKSPFKRFSPTCQYLFF